MHACGIVTLTHRHGESHATGPYCTGVTVQHGRATVSNTTLVIESSESVIAMLRQIILTCQSRFVDLPTGNCL